MRLRIVDIRKTSNPELMTAMLAAGKLGPDMRLEIEQQDFDRLNSEFFGAFALGNIIHTLAKPIAKAMNLGDCSGCGKRRLALNTL